MKRKKDKEFRHKVISESKGVSRIKGNPWIYVSAVLGVLLIFSLSGEDLSLGGLSNIEDDAINFINSNLLSAGSEASLIETIEVGGLYQLKMEIDGQEYDSYVSKDGSLLFPSGINMEEEQLTQQTQPSQQAQQAQVIGTDMDVLIDDDTVKGDLDAPVTIVEWSDFECPFCTRFYTETLGQIIEEYVDTGKVKFVYRDFPLGFHANAQKAAESAECAGEQGKFWEMHDKLFEDGVSGGVSAFKQYAEDINLNTDEFDECLDSGEMALEVQKDMQDGQAVGISGTPGFVINGQLLSGAQPFSAFKAIIDGELAK